MAPLLVDPKAVAAAAVAYEDVPYRSKGRHKERGVDCLGLIICVARDLQIDHGYDYLNYTDWPDGHILQREMDERLVRDEKPIVAAGKIPLFYQKKLKRALHVGVFGLRRTLIDPNMVDRKVNYHTWVPSRYGMALIATYDFPEVASWREQNEGRR